MSIDSLKHWQLHYPSADLAHLIINQAGAGVNLLAREVLDELDLVLGQLEQRTPKGLVIYSSKSSGFFAGADVKEFRYLQDRNAVMAKLERGQQILSRLERLPCTRVAAIHGHCLGGGLELALACNYRIADKESDCKLGLPEVRLGLHPGYGGVVRLSRLINAFAALDLMLTGRTLDARAAAKLGLVDLTTESRHLLEGAERIALGEYKLARKRPWQNRLLALAPVRTLVAKLARRKLEQKVNPLHYPAPYRLLELWQQLPADQSQALAAEMRSVAGLAEEPLARRTFNNLVRVFLLDSDLRGKAKAVKFEGQRVHLVGAGVMGGDIAAWCALRGLRVSLQDAKAEFIAPAMGRAYKLFGKKFRHPALATAALDRLIPDPQGDGVKTADLVIEAISEKLEAKTGLFAKLEPQLKENALLATNTSSIAIEKLAAPLQRPERLVGIHFFNPVAKMQLVEVVRGEQTSSATLQAALGFVGAIGKLPIQVKSSPGFLVNRVLMAYLSEAIGLLEEGVPADVIDARATAFGMPMGPIELADTVGLDICQAVSRELMAHFGGTESALLEDKVQQGKLGRKTGEGFYQWKGGKAVKNRKPAEQAYSQDVRDRLVYSMLNESVACLADGVVADADTLDAGMIFGAGFPPFLGGPIHYIRALGKEECLERLHALAAQGLTRFEPKPGWEAV